MALTVIGIFDNAKEAQGAVEKLVNEGFSRNTIDLSAQTGTQANGKTTTGEVFPDRHQNTSGTRTEEVVDDAKDVGSGIGNFFNSLFGDDEADRDKYVSVANRGSIVTVHATTEAEAERAADILDNAGAVDVNERAAQYGYTGMTAGTTTGQISDQNRVSGDQTLKVMEENLQVGKREVERGGVRLRSRIVARPVEEHVRLREERVTIQRNPVNRPATDADFTAFKEGQIEVVEHAEVPVVSKEARVVEEILVGKEVTEREEVIRDTVRKTDVEVEQINPTDTTVRTDQTNLGNDDVTYATK